jgi:hypothetical protein
MLGLFVVHAVSPLASSVVNVSPSFAFVIAEAATSAVDTQPVHESPPTVALPEMRKLALWAAAV